MPELPEVETIRRGIAPCIEGKRVMGIVVREARLRRPVPVELHREITGSVITQVARRGKYLLLRTESGTVILHLGMSGSLRLLSRSVAAGNHEHLDFIMEDGICLRLRDPRRFSLVLWWRGDPWRHPLLQALGPEPLGTGFDGDYIHRRARGHRIAVKPFLMDGRVVAGIGNIYACESLFRGNVHPRRAAGRISLQRCERLAVAVKAVLHEAIEQGGTTLRDFYDGTGRPGYFAQRLNVYGREGMPCRVCRAPVRKIRQGQRSTWYCGRCQH